MKAKKISGSPWLAAKLSLLVLGLGFCLLGHSPVWGQDPSPARTVVVPPQAATNDPPFGSSTLAGILHLQTVYAAAYFPTGGLFITELRFRPDSHYGNAFTTTVANLEIRLTTTTSEPDHLDSNFAANSGEDETLVFSGALRLSSRFSGPAAGPKEFDIVVPLVTPFLFAPAWGNLLVDVRNLSGSGASLLSGEDSSADLASRLSSGSVSAGFSSPDTGADALEIVYVPTNGPPPPPSPPLHVSRGPYLQMVATNGLVLRWRTNRDADSRVRFGATPDVLDREVVDTNWVRDHSVALTNLVPDTKCFYALGGNDTNWAAGPDQFFVTAPANAKPTRIWVTGDTRTTNYWDSADSRQAVRDAYLAYCKDRSADLWLHMGDIADSGMDQELQEAFFDVYAPLLRHTVVYPCLGNHDLGTDHGQPYLDSFSLPAAGEVGGVRSGSERYYSFNHADIHFVVLDSYGADLGDGDPAWMSAQLEWLREDLSARPQTWLIAVFHSPPYTKGSHDSDWEWDCQASRTNFVPLLESFGVDLVLNGHSHSYERSYLLRGHYGASTTLTDAMILNGGDSRLDGDGPYVKPDPFSGTVYTVVGSSGFLSGGPLNHPAMRHSANALGSLVVDITGNSLEARFLRETGAIEDQFTLLKAPVDAGFRITAIQVRNNTLTLKWSTQPGRQYQVHGRGNLDSDWEPISEPLSANRWSMTWATQAPASSTVFYRVVRLD
jgi:hypothetical protein